MKISISQTTLRILQLITICLFAGRAWQHLRWDAPFRSLLWDEELMQPIIQAIFGINWATYIQYNDPYIQKIIVGFGLLYLSCAIAVFFFKATSKRTLLLRYFFYAGGISLFLLALLYWKSRFYQIGQLIEYAIQVGTPFALVYAVCNRENTAAFQWFLRILIALTFIGHGLYAIGYYPVPGNFQEMFVTVFGVNEKAARTLLLWAAYMDFIVAAFMLLPVNKLTKMVLIYAILWGFITAFARIAANFYDEFFWQSLNQWLFEVAYRIPHGGIPLVLYRLISQIQFGAFQKTVS